MTSRTLHRATLAAALLASTAAWAGLPVAGTIAINGAVRDLPAGAVFTPSPASGGTVRRGAFAFPDTTMRVTVAGYGDVDITYRLVQTNTSMAEVAPDGVAAMTRIFARLELLGTTLPLTVTPCAFGPIAIDLAGQGSVSGLDLEAASFAIPPAAPDQCGAVGARLNALVATANNRLRVHVAGDFSPPAK
jgi:hypothetical protein